MVEPPGVELYSVDELRGTGGYGAGWKASLHAAGGEDGELQAAALKTCVTHKAGLDIYRVYTHYTYRERAKKDSGGRIKLVVVCV